MYDGHNISDCIKLIREGEVDKTKFRKGIREQVSNRLTAIGYWEYVPIPMPQAEKVVKSKTGALLIQQPLSSMRKTS